MVSIEASYATLNLDTKQNSNRESNEQRLESFQAKYVKALQGMRLKDFSNDILASF